MSKEYIMTCKDCGKRFTSEKKVHYCSFCLERRLVLRAHSTLRGVEPEEDIVCEPVYKKRACHDCGKSTYNYRCDKCWLKFFLKYHIVDRRSYIKIISEIARVESKGGQFDFGDLIDAIKECRNFGRRILAKSGV